MGIISVSAFNARELEHMIAEQLIPQWQEEYLIAMDKEATTLFEKWMNSWARKYAIISEQKNYDTVLVYIDNSGAKATGDSSYDERPPRDNVPIYLDKGTRRRFAVMTRGFSSKTAVGLINSGAGSGGLDHQTTKAERGIQARNISETVCKELEGMIQDVWSKVG